MPRLNFSVFFSFVGASLRVSTRYIHNDLHYFLTIFQSAKYEKAKSLNTIKDGRQASNRFSRPASYSATAKKVSYFPWRKFQICLNFRGWSRPQQTDWRLSHLSILAAPPPPPVTSQSPQTTAGQRRVCPPLSKHGLHCPADKSEMNACFLSQELKIEFDKKLLRKISKNST